MSHFRNEKKKKKESEIILSFKHQSQLREKSQKQTSYCQALFEHLTGSELLSPEAGAIFSPILQMRKWRPREMNQVAPNHRAECLHSRSK